MLAAMTGDSSTDGPATWSPPLGASRSVRVTEYLSAAAEQHLSRVTGMGPHGNRRAPVPADCPRGRRAGNAILPAGNVPMIRLGKHERMIRAADLAEFIGGASARLDEPA
ncbi:hypothetical protein Abr02nite_46460 [Paractinoplanes brasiliensis]|nr:hypothetical protein Abr02nite_46460 [Actinoplanes brasiliensis]